MNPLKSHFLKSSGFHSQINTVCILGFGQMGQGIAQACLSSGKLNVRAYDPDSQKLVHGMDKVKISLGQDPSATTNSDVGESIANQTINASIHKSTSVEDALLSSDLIIEAIIENENHKKDLFKMISNSSSLKESAIITTNTSSLSVKDLSASFHSSSIKSRFLGLHFFNPVPKMKLVEIITTDKESQSKLISSLESFVKLIGKESILCLDSPGFVVNRLLLPYLVESIRLYENGISTKEDIDKAMKLGAGYPMGPFTLMDMIGLDTIKNIIDGWSLKFPSSTFCCHSNILTKMVQDGKIGRKSGEGFYKYT